MEKIKRAWIFFMKLFWINRKTEAITSFIFDGQELMQ